MLKCGAILGSLEDLEEDEIYVEDDESFDTVPVKTTNKRLDSKDTYKSDNDLIDRLDIGDDKTSTEEKEKIKKLLYEYCDVFSKNKTDFGKTDIIQHSIELIGDKPKRQGARPLRPDQRSELKQHIQELLDADVIQPSTSEYSSPIVLVKKKDGSTRFCIDYRSLNKVTRPVVYGIPRVNDAINCLSGATIMSTIDMSSGYWQVGMEPASVPKTAFSTMYGQYEWKRMPMGLMNSASTFQRTVDCIMAGLQYESLIVYLDDIIMYGVDYAEHESRLREG